MMRLLLLGNKRFRDLPVQTLCGLPIVRTEAIHSALKPPLRTGN